MNKTKKKISPLEYDIKVINQKIKDLINKIPRLSKDMIFWIMCIVFAVLLYIWSQSNWLTTNNYDILDKSLPDSFNGLKIAHISDVHGLKSPTVLAQIKLELEKGEPNIICITGDLLGSDCDIDRAFDFVDMCNAIAPTFFITGESDELYRKNNNYIEQLGNHIVVLDNSFRRIQINTDFVNIIGIAYSSIDTPKQNLAIEKAQKIIESNGHRNNEYTIVLCHRPDLIDAFDNKSINLALTGHAHGGNINWPLLGTLTAKGQGLFPDYIKGIYKGSRTNMVVSAGVGNDNNIIRIGNPIEISFVVINNGNPTEQVKPNLETIETLYSRSSKSPTSYETSNETEILEERQDKV